MKRLLLFFSILALLIGSAYSANVIITSFNSGILSPTLSGRIDFNKYTSGMQTCYNAIPLPQGGVTRRPGTKYLGTTYNNLQGRIIPFIFSEDQAYILEFTDLLMRVWADDGLVQTVDSNTELLLHADGFDTYATFTDSGTNTHTVTSAGNVKQDTSQKKFGSSAGYFDGTGDYLTVSDDDGVNDYWYMGSSDYSIDFWVMTQLSTGNVSIFEQYDDADNFVRLYLNGSDDISFEIKTGATTKFSVTTSGNYIAPNRWQHVAIVRDGNSIGYSIDGVWVYSGTDTDMDWPELNGTLQIGACTGLTAYKGWIDEFRVSKAARWTIGIDFTVPTFPYPTGDSTGTTYTLATPYSAGDLEKLRFVQSADTMYLVHPDFMPRKLTRTAHDAWSFTAFAWDSASITGESGQPPWQGINVTSTTMEPSATTGVGITITASASFFNTGHIGAYFKQASGIYKITAVNSGTEAVATVIDDMADHVATANWYESSWSQYRGFPSVVCFFENRLVFANNANEPQTLWFSETDDYEDFIVSGTVVDTDAVTVTLAAEQVNAIKWLVSGRKLLIGTTGGEWWLSGDTSENAVTPTSVLIRNATNYGNSGVQPVKIGADTIFVQRANKKIRKFAYQFDTDSYQATDLSVLAETVVDGKTIEEIAFQQNPYQLVWCRLSTGELATLSYMPEHDVFAWAEHEIMFGDLNAGNVESIATIPGTSDDEMYFIVSGVINSNAVRYIVRMHNFYFSAIEDAIFLDFAMTYSGVSTATITGLSYLEGETIAFFTNGTAAGSGTVASGETVMDTAATKAQVGCNYTTDIQTMKLGIGSPIQSVQGLLKRVNKVTARLYKSMYAKVGPDASNLDTLIAAYTAGAQDTEIRILQGRSTDGVVYIRCDEPMPLTVLALILDVEVY